MKMEQKRRNSEMPWGMFAMMKTPSVARMSTDIGAQRRYSAHVGQVWEIMTKTGNQMPMPLNNNVNNEPQGNQVFAFTGHNKTSAASGMVDVRNTMPINGLQGNQAHAFSRQNNPSAASVLVGIQHNAHDEFTMQTGPLNTDNQQY